MNLWGHCFSQIANQEVPRFLPYPLINFQGRNLCNFCLGFGEKRGPHKFFLNLTPPKKLLNLERFAHLREFWGCLRSFVRLGLHHGLFSRFSSSVFSLSYIAARGGGEAAAAASRRRRQRRRTLNIRLRLHSAKLVHKSAVFRKIPWTLLPASRKKKEKNIWPFAHF